MQIDNIFIVSQSFTRAIASNEISSNLVVVLC